MQEVMIRDAGGDGKKTIRDEGGGGKKKIGEGAPT